MSTLIPSWKPFGLALNAYFKGATDTQLSIHQEDGSISKMPVSVFFRTEEELPPLESFALDLCQGKILDVGAGAGSHSLILQNEGFEVHPIDVSDEAVSVMKARGLTQAKTVSFLDFNVEEKFDTVLFLMNGIGLCEKLTHLEKHLSHAKSLCKDDGQILLDSSSLIDPETELEQSAAEINYQLEFDGHFGAHYSWLYINQQTLMQAANNCGLHTQIIYEEEDGSYLARLTLNS